MWRFFTPNTPTGFCTNSLLGTAPVTSPAPCQERFAVKTDAPTWVLGLDYKPDEDVLLYAKYARGYRQGATNPFAAVGFNTFGAEKVDAYEVGAKTGFGGPIRGIFNVSAFYNDPEDQQVSIGAFSSRPGFSPAQAIANAGKSRIQGVEVETTLQPFEGLSLNASYAYLETELRKITVPTSPPGSPYDIIFGGTPGLPATLTPKHKLSATVTYTLPLDEKLGQVSVSATYAYTSRAFYQMTTAAGAALIAASNRSGRHLQHSVVRTGQSQLGLEGHRRASARRAAVLTNALKERITLRVTSSPRAVSYLATSASRGCTA